jgi:hypothetical protein
MNMGHWAEASHNGDAARLTSLLVEPKNGRFPALTERGKELASRMKSSWSGKQFDKPTDFDTWDRCITRGLPPSMFPFNYNNGIEIIQAPGYVVVRLEMIHEARVIPVDGRAALDSAITQWMGESRGHWDGDTLVVETKNIGSFAPGIGVNGGGTRHSSEITVTERFTRMSADVMLYEMHINDPKTWTKPWTIAMPMTSDPNQIYPFECHEHNYGLRNILSAARAAERSN